MTEIEQLQLQIKDLKKENQQLIDLSKESIVT